MTDSSARQANPELDALVSEINDLQLDVDGEPPRSNARINACSKYKNAVGRLKTMLETIFDLTELCQLSNKFNAGKPASNAVRARINRVFSSQIGNFQDDPDALISLHHQMPPDLCGNLIPVIDAAVASINDVMQLRALQDKTKRETHPWVAIERRILFTESQKPPITASI